MHDEGDRGFGIADGLIAIAGLAGGFGLVRAIEPGLTPEIIWGAFAHPREGWSFEYGFGLALELGAGLFAPVVAGWTPACLLLQAVGPRPRWRRLVRRPGFVAPLIATATMVAGLVVVSAGVALSIWEFEPGAGDALKAGAPIGIVAGAGIAWGWGIMALCRACRPRAEWRERLGRLTGASWIAIAAIFIAYYTLIIG